MIHTYLIVFSYVLCTLAVVKPVLGVTDGIANVAHGLSNEINESFVPVVARPPRALERSPIDFNERVVVPVELTACFAQSFILRQAAKGAYEDGYVASVVVERASKKPGSASNKADRMVVLSESFIFMTSIDTTRERAVLEWRYSYSEVSHCLFRQAPDNTVELVLYKNVSLRGAIPIKCDHADSAWRLYRALWSVSFKMGAPGSMTSPDSIAAAISPGASALTLTQLDQGASSSVGLSIPYDTLSGSHPLSRASVLLPSPTASSTDALVGFEEYQFGSANTTRFPPVSINEVALLRRHTEALSEPEEDLHDKSLGELLRSMDERLWRLVSEWASTHEGLVGSRCCAVMILNK